LINRVRRADKAAEAPKPEAKPDDIVLLGEIRDLLKQRAV
jgi:large-conductance mechanosensitive channel